MIIDTNKTKELIICFNKKVNAEDIPPLHKWSRLDCSSMSNYQGVYKYF